MDAILRYQSQSNWTGGDAIASETANLYCVDFQTAIYGPNGPEGLITKDKCH
jgi:hypothetical protein